MDNGLLDRGRKAFAEGAWPDAVRYLTAGDAAEALTLADLERLAVAAYLVGVDSTSDNAWVRAYHECVRQDDHARAARCAFWLAFRGLNAGETPFAGGWIARGRRMLSSCGDCVERGYIGYLVALQAILGGDAATATDGFLGAAEIADRFSDADLATLARHGEGRARIYVGEVTAGMALLDDAMVAVTADEVSPIVAGDTYCSVIEACRELFDVGRAQLWTSALSRWCAAQPDLVPYRGQCLIHRAEILQVRGPWADAVAEAERARDRLLRPPGHPAAGAACRQLADLNRLRGELGRAEDGYRRAHELGCDPQPGLALLRLAQNDVDSAVASIRRALAEADDRYARSRLLGAYVEIMLAAGDAEAARSAADELSGHAAELDAPMLRATAAHAAGAVALAEGAVPAALTRLRRAVALWRELEARYETARAQVLIGAACAAEGDDDGALMEYDAARETFVQLGARPDLERLDLRRGAVGGGHSLTTRELQVLRLLADGETNRAIAAELVLSERTVDRHVSNILAKLGVSSRAAATAYAYRHRLV